MTLDTNGLWHYGIVKDKPDGLLHIQVNKEDYRMKNYLKVIELLSNLKENGEIESYVTTSKSHIDVVYLNGVGQSLWHILDNDYDAIEERIIEWVNDSKPYKLKCYIEEVTMDNINVGDEIFLVNAHSFLNDKERVRERQISFIDKNSKMIVDSVEPEYNLIRLRDSGIDVIFKSELRYFVVKREDINEV